MNIDAQLIGSLASAFRGELILPDEPGYMEACKVYNAMIQKRPALIARCADVADVIAAVNFGREQGLDTALRGGGHSAPGHCLIDGGLTIDLSRLRGIRVDPQARTVRVEGGACWGDVDHATGAFGLATVSGVLSTTGVGGLALGGGHGYLSRKYGLTVDNMLVADVVLADGRFVHASGEENPDLFWALRGGGGNFGVVTSFEFRLHPVKEVIGGPMFWPLDAFATALHWYREWLPRAPEDLYAFFLIGEVPPADPFPRAIRGRKMCGLVWCCTGSRQQAEQALATAREVAAPMFEHVGPVPYPMLQSMFDGLYPPGLYHYWKGDLVRGLSDRAVAEHLRYNEVPTPHSMMHLYPVNGAVHQHGSDETAWPHRDVNWSMVVAGVSSGPQDDELLRRWARDYWESLHPYSAGAAYVNFMMEEGEERVKATYGANYERLRRIKARYDPDNFFHVNQNILPAATGKAGG
jgi:FAD/FMN-containing dehydrogenase